ncbi:DNA repair helicase-like protein, partial [Leptotrombidium deliense]
KYKQKVDEEGSNDAFFGVCRGKLAGLDDSDQYCRGVFIVGLPYPSFTESRVVLKKKYLDENKEAKITSSD